MELPSYRLVQHCMNHYLRVSFKDTVRS